MLIDVMKLMKRGINFEATSAFAYMPCSIDDIFQMYPAPDACSVWGKYNISISSMTYQNINPHVLTTIPLTGSREIRTIDIKP